MTSSFIKFINVMSLVSTPNFTSPVAFLDVMT